MFSKRTPFAASRSIVGVFTIACPAQPKVSWRWSSAKKKRMFGKRDVPSSCGFAAVEEEMAIVAVSSRAMSGLDRVMFIVIF
jgi:hypothetical protein